MNGAERVLLVIGISIVMVGSFLLGTQFPVNPTKVYIPAVSFSTGWELVPPQSTEITSRQNIVTESDIMLGRDMGMVRYRTVYMKYEGKYLYLYCGDHDEAIRNPIDPVSTPITNVTFCGYVFKVRAWNSDYVALIVVKVPDIQPVEITTIVLGRGLEQTQYKDITLSYTGQDIHLNDNKGNWLFFTLTHDLPSNAMLPLNYEFSFGGTTFNVTYWNWDYVKLNVVDQK
jgi:hypothetical protein